MKILITGASSGIGKATAMILGANSKRFSEPLELFLVARRKEKLEEIKEALPETKVTVWVCDLSDKNQVENLKSKHSATLNNIDVIINSAGLAVGKSPFYLDEPSSWENQFSTNVLALMQLTHAVLPGMIARNLGHVININSVAGHRVYAGGSIYCATKHAVSAFTETLRLDLLGKQVRVTSISPGMVETEFSIARFNGDTEKAASVYKGMTPLTPDDIAETILWCINRPKHVNIQDIVIYPTDQASPTDVARK